MSLAQRLFLLVAVALLPAILLQAYNEVERRDARQAEVRDLALRQAEQANSEIGQIVEGVRNVLITVAEEPAVRALDTPACVAFISTLRPRLPQLVSISALDLDGRARCRQDAPPADLRFDDRSILPRRGSERRLRHRRVHRIARLRPSGPAARPAAA